MAFTKNGKGVSLGNVRVGSLEPHVIEAEKRREAEREQKEDDARPRATVDVEDPRK